MNLHKFQRDIIVIILLVNFVLIINECERFDAENQNYIVQNRKLSNDVSSDWGDQYDDFRVNTSQSGMNRWTESSDDTASYIEKPVGKRVMKTGGNPDYNETFEHPKAFEDDFTSVNDSNWESDPPGTPLSTYFHYNAPYGIKRITSYGIWRTVRNNTRYDYELFNFSTKIRIAWDFISANPASLRFYCYFRIFDGTTNIGFRVRHVYEGVPLKQYMRAETVYSGAITQISNVEITGTAGSNWWYFIILKTSDTNIDLKYYKGTGATEYNFNDISMSTRSETISASEFDRNYIVYNTYDQQSGTTTATLWLGYFRIRNGADQSNTLSRTINFQRDVTIGDYSASMIFDEWTYENTSSKFYFGIRNSSNDGLQFYLLNRSLYVSIDGNNYNFATLTVGINYLFKLSLKDESIRFELQNTTDTIYQLYPHESLLIDLYIFFEIEQTHRYDALQISIFNVNAPFQEAQPNIIFSSDWTNVYGADFDQSWIDTYSEEGFTYSGDQPNGSDVKVTFVHYIQDWKALSGLLRTRGSKYYTILNIDIKIVTINSSGLIDYSDTCDTSSPPPNYDVRIRNKRAWGNAAGYSEARLTKITDQLGGVDYDVQRAINLEVGFYAWYKNETAIQGAIRYQNLTEDDLYEDMTDKLFETSDTIAKSTGWFAIQFEYVYSSFGQVGQDSYGSAQIIALSMQKSTEFLDEPIIMSPSNPVILNPPVGFFEGIVNAILAPFLWLGSLIGAIIGGLLFIPAEIFRFLADFFGPMISGLAIWIWESIASMIGSLLGWILAGIDSFLRSFGWGGLLDSVYSVIDTVFQTFGKTFEFITLFLRSDIINITMFVLFLWIVLIPAIKNEGNLGGYIDDLVDNFSLNVLPFGIWGFNFKVPIGSVVFIWIFVTVLGVW